MNAFARQCIAPMAATVMLSTAIWSPAFGGEKPLDTKGEAVIQKLLENEKVQVRETTWKPGQVRASEALGSRVVRVMKGGKLLRTYSDGKTKEVDLKTGDVRWFDASSESTTAYSVKNIGKSDVVLYAVILK